MENKKLKEEDRDLWYKNTANKPSRRPEDEPSVTWMEYFDLMDAYK